MTPVVWWLSSQYTPGQIFHCNDSTRSDLIVQSAREPFETRAREIRVVRVLNRIFTSDSPMRMINCLQDKKQCFASDPWVPSGMWLGFARRDLQPRDAI